MKYSKNKTLIERVFPALIIIAITLIVCLVSCNTPAKLQRKEELADTKAVNRVLGSKPNLDRVTPAVLAMNKSICDTTILSLTTDTIINNIDTTGLAARLKEKISAEYYEVIDSAVAQAYRFGKSECPVIKETRTGLTYDRARLNMERDSTNRYKQLLAHEQGKTQLTAAVFAEKDAKCAEDTKLAVKRATKPRDRAIWALSAVIVALIGGWLLGGKLKGLLVSIKNLIPKK